VVVAQTMKWATCAAAMVQTTALAMCVGAGAVRTMPQAMCVDAVLMTLLVMFASLAVLMIQ
jgi:hypothetical protein